MGWIFMRYPAHFVSSQPAIWAGERGLALRERDRLDRAWRTRREIGHILRSREDLQDVVACITLDRNITGVTNQRMNVTLAHRLVGVVGSVGNDILFQHRRA